MADQLDILFPEDADEREKAAAAVERRTGNRGLADTIRNASDCAVEGCDRSIHLRTWCRRHYDRWRKHGDPTYLMFGDLPDDEIERRFWAHTQKTSSGCIEYVGGDETKPGWHIRIWVRGKRVLAHRQAWQMANGPIPPGIKVCHHCDNPKCVNTDHLFLGTQADNTRDRDRKGRHWTYIGEDVHNAKLTDAAVREIRASSETEAALAARYGVRQTTINRVRNRKTWRHVS